MRGSAIESAALFVPGELDFFNAEMGMGMGPWSDAVLPLLKERMLFFGRMLIPMEFLLFNRGLLSLWRGSHQQRMQLDAFLDGAGLVITRGTKPALREFVPRLEEAKKAGNPAVVADLVPEFAEFLEQRTKGQTSNIYIDSLRRLHNYQDVFLSELERLRTAHRVPDQLVELLVDQVRELTLKYAPNKSLIDGTDALSRGGITRVLRYSDEPLLNRHRDKIASCAHHAYLRNVSSTLRNPAQEVQPLLYSEVQLSRATVLELTESDFVEEMKRITASRPFRIDWGTVRRASWEAIREVICTDPAQAYFAARRAVIYGHRRDDLAALINCLSGYLDELEGRFPTSSGVAQVAIQVAEVASCIMFAVVGYARRNKTDIVYIPIIWAVGEWLFDSWMKRAHKNRQKQQKDLRRDRIRGVATRQFYPEDREKEADRGDGTD